MSVAELTTNLDSNLKISNESTKGEECTICGDNLNNGDPLHELDCGHQYHIDCITEWFGNLEKLNKTTYKNYKQVRECPYCRKSGGWLPLQEGCKPIKGVHKEYEIFKKKLTICGAPFSTKKGTCQNMGRSIYGGYCGIHKKWKDIKPKNF